MPSIVLLSANCAAYATSSIMTWISKTTGRLQIFWDNFSLKFHFADKCVDFGGFRITPDKIKIISDKVDKKRYGWYPTVSHTNIGNKVDRISYVEVGLITQMWFLTWYKIQDTLHLTSWRHKFPIGPFPEHILENVIEVHHIIRQFLHISRYFRHQIILN